MAVVCMIDRPGLLRVVLGGALCHDGPRPGTHQEQGEHDSGGQWMPDGHPAKVTVKPMREQ